MKYSILEICQKLIDLNQPTKINVEKIMGTTIDLQLNNSNEFIDIYKADGKLNEWSSIELRLPKAKGPAFLLLKIKSGKLMLNDVTKVFGKLDRPPEPHITQGQSKLGETVISHRINSKKVTWIISKDNSVNKMIID